MISTISQYSSILSNAVIEDLKTSRIETNRNFLIQFNSLENVFLNTNNFDTNISIPKCNLNTCPEEINSKYKYIDTICVFNQYEKRLFQQYNEQIKVLNIPIKNNNINNKLPKTQNHLINFGYIGNLLADKPIIVDVINTFSVAAITNKKISLCIFLEAEAKAVDDFRNAIYDEINIDPSVETRIIFITQQIFTQNNIEIFINSIDNLFSFNCFFTDSYSVAYALNQQKIVYSLFDLFDDIHKIESFTKTVIYNGQLTNYLSPGIEEMTEILIDCRDIKYSKKQDNYINTGIGSLLND